MRTVLYVSHTARLGGAELSLFGLLAALDRRRYRPVLVLPKAVPPSRSHRNHSLAPPVHAEPDGEPAGLSELDENAAGGVPENDLGLVAGRLGVEVWRLPLEPPRRPRTPWEAARVWRAWRRNREQIAEIARRRAAVLIHANSPAAAFQSAGAPLISHWRDWRLPLPAAWLLARRAALVLVPSQALAARARRYRLPAVRAVPNGIDPDHFRPAGAGPEPGRDFAPSPAAGGDRRSHAPTWRGVLPAAGPDQALTSALAAAGDSPPGGAPILMVAQWAPWKRHDIFLKALAWLRERRSATRAWVAGGAPEGAGSEKRLAELRRQASALGLDGAVEWLGPVSYARMPELYRGASVLLHPSPEEPWGRDVAEAMACGCPVAAAAGGGPAELLAGGGGILTRPGDSAALGRAAMSFLDNPERRAAVGAAGRRQAERLSLARHAETVMSIYDQMR